MAAFRSLGGFALASSLCTAACTPERSAPAAPKGVLEIGSLLALSGDLSGTGADNADAENLALEQINAGGGVLGRPLKLVVEDDATTEGAARAGYSRLVARDVPVIIGPSSSSQVVAVADLIAASRTVTIGRTSTSPLLTTLADGDFFFRVAPSDVFQSRVLASLVLEAGVEKLCVVHRDDTYGALLAEATIERLGSAVAVTRSRYNPALTDLSFVLRVCDPLLCTSDAGADCDETKVGLLMVTYVNDGVAILQDRRGWSAKRQRFFFTDGSRDTELLRRGLPAEVLEGATGTHPSAPDPGSPEGEGMRSYQSAFRARFGRSAPAFTEYSFDAVYAAAVAMEIAGEGASREAIRDAMRKLHDGAGEPITAGAWGRAREAIRSRRPIQYRGLTGNVRFDEDGDVTPPHHYRVWRITSGESVTVRVQKVTE